MLNDTVRRDDIFRRRTNADPHIGDPPFEELPIDMLLLAFQTCIEFMFKSESTPCDGPFVCTPMIRPWSYRKLFSGPLLRNPKTMTDKIVDVAEALSKISSVTQLIRSGGVIALPTDTVYGVACSIDSAQALMRIQQLKGRSSNKPMAICMDKVSRIPHWCDTTGLPDGLLNNLLPGPVTVLLPRHSSNHCLDRPHLNPGVQMVGVRVPDHGFIQSLVSALSETEPNGTMHGDHVSPGHPLVLTSANLSGNASALTIEEFSSIWPTLDLIIDGGVIPGADPNDFNPPCARSGSTIVDLSQASKKLFRITRNGSALESTVKILEQNYGMRWLKSSPNSPVS